MTISYIRFVFLQFISVTAHAVYKKFHLSELLLDEIQRRFSIQSQWSRPMFRLFLRNCGVAAMAINIEKYNNVLGSFEKGVEIALDNRTYFNAIVHKNQLFVLGGSMFNRYLNCVSK